MPLLVQPWPASGASVPTLHDGRFVIGVATSAERGQARLQVRAATRAALAAVLGLEPQQIMLTSTPGSAPQLTLKSNGRSLGCSFAHEPGYALAAVSLHGAVGVDLMRVQELTDWQAVARDYLGPAVCAALAATPAAARAQAFAIAWCEREAALKCAGLGLSEWSDQMRAPAISVSSALLGYGLAAALAVGI